ncbi:hypothetical protein BK648_24815 [Pseudomonas poae]|uniref:Uncharacterized protein n=1 Tax=Pseudomonas poae TaxID=200451 RepID=A0A423ERS2_9PSED|nr:hypothetical protein BK648_24815 [Pseudomonas poae]
MPGTPLSEAEKLIIQAEFTGAQQADELVCIECFAWLSKDIPSYLSRLQYLPPYDLVTGFAS